METVKSVRQSIMTNNWAVSIDLTDAYLHIPIHPRSRKYLPFVYEHQVFQFMALPFGMSVSPWIFTKLMNIIATHLPLHAVSLFPYLDDWLIRDLIHNRFISHTKYTFQIHVVKNLSFIPNLKNLIHNRFISHTKYTFQIHVVKNLSFIPNLKKSDLIPTKEFTFIGVEFLTQQKIVRVPANRVKALILTIKTILSQTQVSARTFLSLLGKFIAAADLILLGRLHLQSLQMCLLSVWKPHIFPLDHKVMINSMIKFHLKWWTDTNWFVQGMPIHPSRPQNIPL